MYYVIYFYFYPTIGYYISDVTILECAGGYNKKNIINPRLFTAQPCKWLKAT